ncbi:hypothetical protein AQV86_00135 [Nanohaloarchaea archaeon SG9]|nr:hypothetical protein AQV86_00135 [Nanohaloarchaea archaeon SG9]
MKSVRKLKKYGAALAGSAVLLGATLTGASASNHDLGDYPQPFVDEDGNVQSSIVVGEDAATADVVGAIDIAGSLGQQAFSNVSSGSSVSVDGEEAESGIRSDVSAGKLMVDKSDYSVLKRENVEDSDGNNHFISESVGLDSDGGSGVKTEVNGSEVLTVVPQASVDYEISYSPGFETGEQVSVLGEEYELVTVSGSQADLGSKETASDLSIGDSFRHGPYTVNVEGGNSNDGEILVNVMEDGEQVDSGQLSAGESMDANEEFSVSANTVFYSSSEEAWIIELETVYSDVTLEQGEDFPLDTDYRVQKLETSNGDTLEGLELTNNLKTVDEPDAEDETEHLKEGESFQGPNDYFRIGFEGLTDEPTDSIEVKDGFEVKYQDKEGFEHTLNISRVEASNSDSLYSSNPYLNNGDTESEVRFYSSDTTWEEGSDAMVLDRDNDGVYTSDPDNLVDVDGSAISNEYDGDDQEVGQSDNLQSFDGSENLYATTVSGWSDSEAIFYDRAGNGIYDEEGIVQGAGTVTTDLSATLNPQISIGFDGNTAQNLVLENTGSTTVDQVSSVGLETDPSGDIPAGSLVAAPSGNYYVVSSYSNSGQSTTVSIAGASSDDSNLAGGQLTKQSLGTPVDTNADTTSGDQTINGDGTVTVDVGSDPGLSDGDVFVVSSGDTTIESGDPVLVATGASDSTSVASVGEAGATVPGSANITTVSMSDTTDTADLDDYYLNDGSSIADSINAAISDNSGSISSGTATFDGTDTYKIESDQTGDTQTSSVTVEAGTNNDVAASLNLDSASRDYASNQDLTIEDVNTNLVDGNSYTAVDGSTGVTLKFHDDSGDSTYQIGEDVIDDKGGSGTYSPYDDTLEAGSGSPSNGATLETGLDSVKFGVDSSGTVYSSSDLVAVDENGDDVYDSGDTLIAGDAPGGIVSEADPEKTVYTDVSGHPVRIEWDPSAGSSGEATLGYETFETTLAPGESVSQSTGYGFTLDADFNDLNGDTEADLSVSNADTTLDTRFGAEISGLASNVVLNEHGSGQVNVGFDGSNEIDSVSFGGTPSSITSEDEETYTDFGSRVSVGSDMSDVGLEVPEEKRNAVHTVGGEASTGTQDVTAPAGWPQTGALDTEEVENHSILVGGPAINDLTAELAEQDLSRAQENYSEGTGYLELVDEAFNGKSALVVAGHSAADTRGAAEFLANYGDHSESFEEFSELEIDTSSGEAR